MRRLIAALALLTATTAHATITATVFDEEGKPLAGARVRAFAREESGALRKRLLSKEPETTPIVTATTGADGRVSLDVEGQPVVRLVVDATGRAVELLDATDGSDTGSVVLTKAVPQRRRITSGGVPVGNALVAAGEWYVAHSDAHGEYEQPTLAGGFERYYVIHPGYAVFEGTLSSEPSSRRKPTAEVALLKGQAVKGRVLATDGTTPVPHAVIFVGGWPLAESDDGGMYSVAHAPQTWRAIFARAPKLVGVGMIGGGSQAVDIKLAPAVSFSGTVRNGKDPVAGAYVSVYRELEPAAPGTVSNAKGHFTIDGLLAGHYFLYGTHPDFNINRRPLVLPSSGEHDVSAEALVAVVGHVVDEAHKPVAGARVTISLASIRGGTSMPSPVPTSATGEFKTRLFPGGSVQFVVIKAGYAAGLAGPLAVEKTRNVAITLPAGFPSTIRVVDGQKNPVPSVAIEITRAAGNLGARSTLLPCTETSDDCRTTKADGTVAERLTEGSYDFVVSGDAIASKRVSAQQLTARASTVTIMVEHGVEVSGQVLRNDGTPVAGATITERLGSGFRMADAIPRAGVVSSADGTFTLKGLPAKQVSITASTSDTTPSLVSEPVVVTAPSKDVILRLPSPTTLSGRVAEKAVGTPITDFTVMTNVTGRPSTSLAIHSDDGTFTVQVVPGRTDLHVAASGYVRATLTGLNVEEGKPLTGVDVLMGKGGGVVGRVTSAGQPVEGVYLSAAADPMTPRNAGATSDTDGNYILDGVEPGELTLQARKQGWLTKEKGITTKAGEDIHVDLELDHGGVLNGRVIDRDGHPLEGARVNVRAGGNARTIPATSLTEADGTFTLSGLPEGHLALMTQHSGYVTATTDDVDPAQSITVTLDKGGSITGRVTGLSEADLNGVNVAASYGSAAGTNARVDGDGSFTIQGVPEGTVRLFAIKPPGRRSGSKTVTVTNGSAPFVELDFADSASVSGRITREGKPVAGGSISFSGTKGEPGGNAVFGPDGTYQVSGLQNGEFRVFINLYGLNATSTVPNVTVAGTTTHDFDLTGRVLRGHVVDASNGAPLADVLVQLRPTSPAVGISRQATTDSDGRFTMDLLDDGQYHLVTQRAQYAALQQDLNVPSQDLELRLDTTNPTMIRVIDGATGQPMAGDVSVADSTSKAHVAFGRATVDVGARLYLPEGRYTMNVSAMGYTNANLALVVPSPEVQVTLQRGGTVTFRLHGTEANYQVRFLVNGQSSRTDWISSRYRTSLDGIAPGTYTVEVNSSDGKTPHGSYPVTLQAGQTVFVDVN
jgi:5-hydroxyisourate hydrolase-like protein (transthyretin family)